MTVEKAYKELVYWVQRSREMDGYGIEENIQYYSEMLNRLLDEKIKEKEGYILDHEIRMEGLEQVVFLTDILLSGRYNFTRSISLDGEKASFKLSYLTIIQKKLIDAMVGLLKIDSQVGFEDRTHPNYLSESIVELADLLIAEGCGN